MSVKREAPEPIEQHDAGNVKTLRKRIMAALALVFVFLMNTLYLYHGSAYLRNSGDWRWFWIGEACTGVLLFFGVVQILRKGP
ncbi:MAG: hypothetical protein ABSE44_01625 [Candidatus Sulfotelmatobacter sp.]|jgi:hypothetical protein